MNKNRRYKKLCKKAAEIMNFNDCYNDDSTGVFYITFPCGGDDSEWDSKDCWPWLVDLFHGDVNTVIDENSDCGLSWSDTITKSTPKNVFAWAKAKEWQ